MTRAELEGRLRTFLHGERMAYRPDPRGGEAAIHLHPETYEDMLIERPSAADPPAGWEDGRLVLRVRGFELVADPTVARTDAVLVSPGQRRAL